MPGPFIVNVTSSSPGNFTVAHGLSSTPQAANILMTSDGFIHFQPGLQFDGTYLYLTASDTSLTAIVYLWTSQSPYTSTSSTTTTVQNIIASVSRDMLNEVGQGSPILVDYINRVSLEILRTSRWQFLLSPTQRFITLLEQTDYWIGPVGTGPSTAVDTNLNIVNLGIIKENSVIDRSNFRTLQRIKSAPNIGKLAFPSGMSRASKPRVYANYPDTPNIINIYPAPNNQNIFQPTPYAANTSTATGGALAARIYQVQVSYVDTFGNESNASDTPAVIYVPVGKLLVVNPPFDPVSTTSSGIKYDRFNVYAVQGTGSGANVVFSSAILQTITPQSSTWTEPITGLLTSGNPAPTINNLTPLSGYIIEFRYYQNRVQLVSTGQVLQIPDDYKDVVVAGTNWLVAKFLNRNEDVQFWLPIYKDGLRQIIRDKNLFPKGTQDFMGPDPAGIAVRLPSIETVDLGNELLM